MARPCNLLLVFADQMRGQDVCAAGNRQLITPNLDRLASQGVLCTNAIANCPVCTPSRGSLLTGLDPTSHGAVANDIPIRTDVPSLGTLLRDAGYRTGYIGKWHLDGVPRDRFTPPGPRRLGFDDYWAVWNCHHRYFEGRYFLDTDEVRRFDGYEPDGQTELAIRFMEERRSDPFALVLSWGPPHDPYEMVPERFLDMYDPEAIELRPNVPLDDGEKVRTWRMWLAQYYAAITALDHDLGRLMETLDRLGIADSTLVVFTSDHGDMVGSQGIKDKEKPWEESILVPLMLRAPSLLPAGRRERGVIGIMDLMPTILELLGVDVPDGVHGKSAARLLRGERFDVAPRQARGGEQRRTAHRPEPLGPELVAEGHVEGRVRPPACVPIGIPIIIDQGAHAGLPEWRGVRTARYTYARLRSGEGWLLYDNQKDPYQQRNLIGDASAAEIRKKLDATTDRWLERLGDPCLPWQDIVRRMGIVELWNARERYMHGERARILPSGP